MLFDSPRLFLVLHSSRAPFYWSLSHRAQNIFLLVASYFFYGWWDWRFLALMIGSTTVDFLIGQKISPKRSDPNRRKWFIFSLILNFTILGVFKYFDFFAGSFVVGPGQARSSQHTPPIDSHHHSRPEYLFILFREVAYIVDVYKGSN